MGILRGVLLAFGLVVSLPSAQAGSDGGDGRPERWVPLVIAGTQLAESAHYSYLGAIRPFAGAQLGQGWFQSLIVSYLGYEYDHELNSDTTAIDARAPGLAWGLGHAWNGNRYSISLSVAAGWRYYDLSPDLPQEEPRGSELSLTPQLQAAYRFDSLEIDLLANRTLGPDSGYVRSRVVYPLSSGRGIGPEYVFQEGRNYRNQQLGLFYKTRFFPASTIELSAGAQEEENGDIGPYIGLGFSRVF